LVPYQPTGLMAYSMKWYCGLRNDYIVINLCFHSPNPLVSLEWIIVPITIKKYPYNGQRREGNAPHTPGASGVLECASAATRAERGYSTPIASL
jgi:hypothetical protein